MSGSIDYINLSKLASSALGYFLTSLMTPPVFMIPFF